MLQITPTGPWGQDLHPALPLTTEELLADLRDCVRAGAEGVHLHVRDESGAETLEPDRVNAVCRQVRDLGRELGHELEIGLTTGAWIEPDLHERIALIREWDGVDCATVNLSEEGFEQVMAAMVDVGVGIDVGLWAPQEIELLTRSGALPYAQRISIELQPGEPYHLDGDPLDLAREINDALDAAGSRCPRLTHGADAWTWPLVRDAVRRGHDTRVGFEDSVFLPSGERATCNADLVRAASQLRRPDGGGAG